MATPKPRWLPDVIKSILSLIPEGPDYARLRRQLESLQETAVATSPEQIASCWRRLAEILQGELGDAPETEWRERIIHIISGA